MADELAQIDAPLLVGLTTLLETASVTAAARTLGRTQSAAADYATVALLAPWIAVPRHRAPGVVIQVTPVDASSIDPLARGDLDLAIAPYLPAVGLEQFVVHPLLSDRPNHLVPNLVRAAVLSYVEMLARWTE
jgi:DNA-binding transcriptional LysR family regulator